MRLSAYMRRHLNVHGQYSFQLPDLVGTRRALRGTVDASDDEERCRRRVTGAEMLTARRAVPDVPAA